MQAPHEQAGTVAILSVLGLAGWTAVEYVLHRFVLHGVQPFRRWHAMHHSRPAALICAPTALSAALVTSLVFLPAWTWIGLWRAGALTLGVLVGYLLYSVTHHAIHHWRANHPWLQQRKRWHAIHHCLGYPGCYGVTSGVWDWVFKTSAPPSPE